MSERCGKEINSADFLGLRHQEAVRLNTYWDAEVYQAFVAVVDSACQCTKQNAIIGQKVQGLRVNVGG